MGPPSARRPAMLNASLLTIFAGFAAVVQIFFGFLYYVERLRGKWSLLKQASGALGCLIVFVTIAALIVRGKVFIDERELLTLREIAYRAYQHQDYDTTIKLLTWA